jgi:hypothetical protein
MAKRIQLPSDVKQSVEANKSLRGDGIVQHTNAAKGKTSAVSVANLLPYLPKVSGGGTYRGIITQCPNEDNVGMAHRYINGEEDTENVEVYIEPGLWCNKIGRKCLLHVAIDDIADYIASDLLPIYAGSMASGTYEAVSGALAPKQLSVTPQTCENP